ncbi:hypothetical protein RQP46_010029 [Phenoliferia psychrophenolica]
MDHPLLVVLATLCLAALFRRSLQQLSCYILVALIVSVEGVAYFIFQTSILEPVQQDDKVVIRDCVPLVFQSKPTAPSSVAEICTPYRKRKPMMMRSPVRQKPKDQHGSGIIRPRYTPEEVRTRDLERIQRAEVSPTGTEPALQPPGPPPSNPVSNKLRHRIPPLPADSHPRCDSCGQSLRKSIVAKANLFVARKPPPKSVVTYRKSAVVKSTSAITPSTLPLHPSSNLDVFIGTMTYEEKDSAKRCRAWVLQDSDQTSPVADSELTPSEVEISTETFSPPLKSITSTPPASKASVLDLPILASPIQSNLTFEPLPTSPPEPEAVVSTSPPVFEFDILPQSSDISNPVVERDDPSPVSQQDVEPTPDPSLDMTPVFPVPSPPIESDLVVTPIYSPTFDIESFSVELAAESGLGIDSPPDLHVEPAFKHTLQFEPAPSPSAPVAVPNLAFVGDAAGLNESAPINSLGSEFGALSSTPQPEISPSPTPAFPTPLPPPIQHSTPFNFIQDNIPDKLLADATPSRPLRNVDDVKSTTRINSSPVQAVQPTPVGRASPAATQSSRREASGSSSTRSSGTAAAALASTFYLKQFERDYDLEKMKKKLRWIFEEQGGAIKSPNQVAEVLQRKWDHEPNCFMDFRLRVQFDPEKFDLHRFFEVYPQHKDSTVDTKTDLLCLVWDNRPHMLDPFRHSTLKHYAREQKRLARRPADNSGR